MLRSSIASYNYRYVYIWYDLAVMKLISPQGVADQAQLEAARRERENLRGTISYTEECNHIVDRHDKVAELELCVLAYQDFGSVEKFWKENSPSLKPEALSKLEPIVMQPALAEWSFKISTS